MTTPIKGLPELSVSQASKEATHNEGLRGAEQGADFYVVKDKDLTAPPGSPAAGDAYIVAASATGAWASQDGKIAWYLSSSWNFITPREGTRAYLQDENAEYAHDGAAWVAYSAASAGALLAANNLSDVANKATSLSNLFAADISPAQLTANADDYNPTSLSTSTVLRVSSDASRNITGLQGGADGRVIVLANVGSNPIVLKDSDAASAAANRFALDADLTLSADMSAVLIYDATSSRWRLMAIGRSTVSISSGDVTAALGYTPLKAGKVSYPVAAAAMIARTTNGAASGTAESTTNKVMTATLDFDQSTDEFAQFTIAMPKNWDEGTVTAQFYWTAGSTGNVVWGLQGVALSDDDAIDAAFGTAQTVTDGVTAAGDLMISAETGAITIAGTPAAGDLVVFQVYRDADNGSDTLAADAKLIQVKLFITLNAADEA